MPDAVNYKDTICLPKTDFPMKADLHIREPQIIKKWIDEDVHGKMASSDKSQNFVFTDGPPYANGDLHMGHALNKILKDIVVKYQNMAGKRAVFVPGWDCHGLPIEMAVLKSQGEKAKTLTPKEIRALSRKEAQKWIDIQMEQFQRFGVIADWKHPYKTMDFSYEAEIVRTLAQILETGCFYRGEKPVYWCLPLQTALAEAEVEYREHKSPSIYVGFDLIDKDRIRLEQTLGIDSGLSKVQFVIWTTTPWTLPANLAIAVHPDFDYGLFKATKGTSDTNFQEPLGVVIAKDLKDTFEAETGLQITLIATLKGGKLEGYSANHPFVDRQSPVLLGDHVTLESGSGMVHTAPGHGLEDYELGVRYGLDIYSPVNDSGRYTKEVPQWEGLKVFEANPKIVEALKTSGHLLGLKEITHSYPHCWRTKTPLIFRATPQWFLKMDDDKYPIRRKALEEIDKVRWVPDWGINRIKGMIENRPDWCLSRQRSWGVPIPVFYCVNCSEALVSQAAMLRVADAIEETGIDAYHDIEASRFTSGETCSSCKSSDFRKGNDIFDVWFESGCAFSAVQKKREAMATPADLYLEGSDQHRGWFHTSLLTSVAADGHAPYKQVLTHGFVMYAKGQKMSKSLGNTVDPLEVIKKHGAETLRLWAAHEDYSKDLTFNPETVQRLVETYRRLRNTMRFILGSLNEFQLVRDEVPFEDLLELDRWMLSKLANLISACIKSYESYEFYKIYHAINQFVTVELSSLYMDVIKDRLYTWKRDGVERRSCQTTLFYVGETLTLLLAPIVSFLAEESHAYFEKVRTGSESADTVFVKSMPNLTPMWQNEKLDKDFEVMWEVRSHVTKALEELRNTKVIGSSLEAQVRVEVPPEFFAALDPRRNELAQYFIVSKVDLTSGNALNISAKRAEGEKCARCWNLRDDVNEEAKFPGVCAKCVQALA